MRVWIYFFLFVNFIQQTCMSYIKYFVGLSIHCCSSMWKRIFLQYSINRILYAYGHCDDRTVSPVWLFSLFIIVCTLFPIYMYFYINEIEYCLWNVLFISLSNEIFIVYDDKCLNGAFMWGILVLCIQRAHILVYVCIILLNLSSEKKPLSTN